MQVAAAMRHGTSPTGNIRPLLQSFPFHLTPSPPLIFLAHHILRQQPMESVRTGKVVHLPAAHSRRSRSVHNQTPGCIFHLCHRCTLLTHSLSPTTIIIAITVGTTGSMVKGRHTTTLHRSALCITKEVTATPHRARLRTYSRI